jgi:hypothetical protein
MATERTGSIGLGMEDRTGGLSIDETPHNAER